MNQQVYKHVLQQNLLPWAKAIFQNNFVLTLDNALPNIAQDFLEKQDIRVMDSTSKSPGVNP